jgi:hypothetical protein
LPPFSSLSVGVVLSRDREADGVRSASIEPNGRMATDVSSIR